jgi:DNA-binding helix-hairpin-helix protein with protein kinase domain
VLAVIIFRLLNNGLHPYQGVDAKANLPGTLQERIFAGLYAYGKQRSLDADPAPASIHESLEDSREGFLIGRSWAFRRHVRRPKSGRIISKGSSIATYSESAQGIP